MFSGYFKKKQQADQVSSDSYQQQDASTSPVTSPLTQGLVSPPVKKEADDIEYLFIEDNPFIKAPRPTGSFGPLPMRTNSDKLLYGTGISSTLTYPRRIIYDGTSKRRSIRVL
jgi:hypothetical protein